jgi:hypothetical protein
MILDTLRFPISVLRRFGELWLRLSCALDLDLV